jgi:hypothetical protein
VKSNVLQTGAPLQTTFPLLLEKKASSVANGTAPVAPPPSVKDQLDAVVHAVFPVFLK